MNEILVLLETVRAGGWGVLIALLVTATGLLLFDRGAKATAGEVEEALPMRKAA